MPRCVFGLPSCACPALPHRACPHGCGAGLAERAPAQPERDPRSYTPKHLADKFASASSSSSRFSSCAEPVSSSSRSFTRSFGPYVLVDGTVVADDFQHLISSALLAPINLNERGEETSVEVWTNVATDGTEAEFANADTCDGFRVGTDNFRGVFGTSTETGSAWTDDRFDTCDQQKAVYCFGQ